MRVDLIFLGIAKQDDRGDVMSKAFNGVLLVKWGWANVFAQGFLVDWLLVEM